MSDAVHDAVEDAMADPGHQPLLDQFIQEPWYRTGPQYRTFAEKYFVDVKPMLVKSGLAKGQPAFSSPGRSGRGVAGRAKLGAGSSSRDKSEACAHGRNALQFASEIVGGRGNAGIG